MRRADILVVGQGFAGTALAFALEAAGLSFEIADAGHANAASAIAAGIMNPITGRRLVKSWRVEELLPLALTAYATMERKLEAAFCRRVRIRRLFADDRERVAFTTKLRAGEFDGVVTAYDEHGFWISQAARIDGARLLQAARRYWLRTERLREVAIAPAEALADYAIVIDCRGVATTRDPVFGEVPWEYSKGEMLSIASTRLEPDLVLNRRQWVVAVDETSGWVGATHEPGVIDDRPTPQARAILEASARDLLLRDFAVTGHVAGVRVTLRDKLPVVGVLPHEPRLGVINALGAKGALWAPWLAQQWVAHLAAGASFDPAIDVARFC